MVSVSVANISLTLRLIFVCGVRTIASSLAGLCLAKVPLGLTKVFSTFLGVF
jgi:hypothetical protein